MEFSENEAIQALLDKLEANLQALTRQNERLVQENGALRRRVDELQTREAAKEKETKRFKKQINLANFAKNLDALEDKTELKAQIDRLIREIETCLNTLSD